MYSLLLFFSPMYLYGIVTHVFSHVASMDSEAAATMLLS
jgi:hypothetical protein